MTGHTRRILDGAVDELKRNGYMVFVVLHNMKLDDSLPMGSNVEVLCSETNDPKLLAAMAKDCLTELSNPKPDATPSLAN